MKKIKESKNNQTLIAAFVVCIITFILLIMGATYAYFQATNNASGTTNLDATTEAIGNVVVTNPTEELYLKLSAYEMQEDQKNTSYYATSTNGDGVVYASERENNVFANYSIEGGTDNTIYNCTFKLNITKPQDIRSGDMNLEISLLNGAKINGGSTLTTDLYNAASSYNVSFSAKGNGNGNLITGDIKLNNTTSVQDHLIGKTINATLSVSELTCEVAEPAEELAAGLYKPDGSFVSWEQLTSKEYLTISWSDPDGNYESAILSVYNNNLYANYYPFKNENFSSEYLVGKLVIPEGITGIRSDSFWELNNLTEIVLPSSMNVIGSTSFTACSSLTSITIPSSVTVLEEFVFSTPLSTINYLGTQAQWNAIEKATYEGGRPSWNSECQKITVHCTDGDIIIPAN